MRVGFHADYATMRLRFWGVALWVRVMGWGGITVGLRYDTPSFLQGRVVDTPGGPWSRC